MYKPRRKKCPRCYEMLACACKTCFKCCYDFKKSKYVINSYCIRGNGLDRDGMTSGRIQTKVYETVREKSFIHPLVNRQRQQSMDTDKVARLSPSKDSEQPPTSSTRPDDTKIPVMKISFTKDEEKENTYSCQPQDRGSLNIPVIVSVATGDQEVRNVDQEVRNGDQAVSSEDQVKCDQSEEIVALSSETETTRDVDIVDNQAMSTAIPTTPIPIYGTLPHPDTNYRHLKFHENSFETLKAQELDHAKLIESIVNQIAMNQPSKMSRPRGRPPSIYTHIKQLPNSSTNSNVNVQSTSLAANGPRKRGRPKGSTTKIRHKVPNNGMGIWGGKKGQRISNLDMAILSMASQSPGPHQLLQLPQHQMMSLLYQQQQQQNQLQQQPDHQGLLNGNISHLLNNVMSQNEHQRAAQIAAQQHAEQKQRESVQKQAAQQFAAQQFAAAQQLAAAQQVLGNPVSLRDYNALMNSLGKQDPGASTTNMLDLQLQQNIMNLEKILQSQVMEQQKVNTSKNAAHLEVLLNQLANTIQHTTAQSVHAPQSAPKDIPVPPLQGIPISITPRSTPISHTSIPVIPQPSKPQSPLQTPTPLQMATPPRDEATQLLQVISNLSSDQSQAEQLLQSLIQSNPSPQPSTPSNSSPRSTSQPLLQFKSPFLQATPTTPNLSQSIQFSSIPIKQESSAAESKLSDLEQLISSFKSGSPIKSEPADLLLRPFAARPQMRIMSKGLGLDQLLPKTRGRPPGSSTKSPNSNKQSPLNSDGKRHRGRPRKYPEQFYQVVNGKVKYPGAKERRMFYPMDEAQYNLAGLSQLHMSTEERTADITPLILDTTPLQPADKTSPPNQPRKRGRPKGSKNKPCLITSPEQLLDLRPPYPEGSPVWAGLPEFKQNQITAVLSGLNQKMFRQSTFPV